MRRSHEAPEFNFLTAGSSGDLDELRTTTATSSPKLFDQRLPADRIIPHQKKIAKRR
jgi:hypothetical protein